MKKLLILCAAAGSLALGTGRPQAAETNLVQNISLRLLALSQGLSTTNKTIVNENLETATIDTKRLISALGSATTNVFSKNAQLQLITTLMDGTNDDSIIVVRDGTNPPVRVGMFFTLTNFSSQVHSATFKSGVLVTETRYRYRGFDLHDDTNFPSLDLHITSSGIWRDTFDDIISKGHVLGRNSSASFDLNGRGNTGDTNHEFVVEGSFSLGLGKVIVK